MPWLSEDYGSAAAEIKAARLREIGYNRPGLNVHEQYDLARSQGRIKDEQTTAELAGAPSYTPEEATRMYPWRRVGSAENGKFLWQHTSGEQAVSKEMPRYTPVPQPRYTPVPQPRYTPVEPKKKISPAQPKQQTGVRFNPQIGQYERIEVATGRVIGIEPALGLSGAASPVTPWDIAALMPGGQVARVPGIALGTKTVFGAEARNLLSREAFGGIFSVARGTAKQAAKKAGSFLGKAQTALRKPYVSIPISVGLSLGAPAAGEEVQRTTFTSKEKELTSGEIGEARLTRSFELVQEEAGKTGIRLPDFSFGTTGFGGTTTQIGQELGFGFFGQEVEVIGGISEKKLVEIGRKAAIESGLSGTSATVYGEAFAKIYRGRQAGGIVGLFSAGTITEYMGTKTIGPIVTRGLTGQVAGVGVKGAYKTGFGVAKQTIPRFIGLGIYEGVVSAATAKQAQRRSLFMAPEEYLIGGVAGGISAPLLGAPVIGFGAARAIKAGRSPVARTAGIVTRATGSILDVYEYPTDIAAAKIFGLPEPSFRIVPGKGKIVTRAGRIRVRTPVTIGILQPSSIADFTGISTIIPSVSPKTTTPTPTTPTPIIPTPIPPIPTPTPTPIITITPTPSETTTNIFGDEITTTTNINTFIGTPISVPITTPIARAGLPALFPVSPFGEGGAGRRGKGRTTFLNEFLFARSLLGTTLAKRGQKIVKERKLAFGLKQPKRKKGKSLFGIRLFKSRGKRK